MKNSPQYTNQRMGLDLNIWVVLIVTSILCLGLVGYQQAYEKKCMSFNIGVKNVTSGNSRTVYAGEILSLSTSAAPGNRISWNFGDRSDSKEGSMVMHSYNKEGDYSISALVNGKCEQISVVSVLKYVPAPSAGADSNFAVAVSIMGKEDPEVGEPITFSSNTTASSYEWTILDRRDYETKKSETAIYTFRTPGRYVLKLKLNNDPSRVTTKYIMVIPPSSTALLPTTRLIPPPPHKITEEKPEEKAVETKPLVEDKVVEEKPVEVVKAKKIFYIPNDRFMDYLKEAVEGSKDLAFFNQYLNNGGETLVHVKGDDKLIKFSELFQRIHDNKKITIKEVTIDREPNNDVLKINIAYKKKGLF